MHIVHLQWKSRNINSCGITYRAERPERPVSKSQDVFTSKCLATEVQFLKRNSDKCFYQKDKNRQRVFSFQFHHADYFSYLFHMLNAVDVLMTVRALWPRWPSQCDRLKSSSDPMWSIWELIWTFMVKTTVCGLLHFFLIRLYILS